MNYRIEWTAGPLFLGAVLLPFIAPPFAMVLVLLVALAALAAVVALAGAVVASPYLLVRSVRRHRADRPAAHPAAQTGQAAQRPGIAALATPTPAASPQ
jgi:hypothetical protein